MNLLGAHIYHSAATHTHKHPLMGNAFTQPVPNLPGANAMLSVGSRVQTQYTRDEGGDDLWYTGTVRALYDNSTAAIAYDDGDSWTGPAIYCACLHISNLKHPLCDGACLLPLQIHHEASFCGLCAEIGYALPHDSPAQTMLQRHGVCAHLTSAPAPCVLYPLLQFEYEYRVLRLRAGHRLERT